MKVNMKSNKQNKIKSWLCMDTPLIVFTSFVKFLIALDRRAAHALSTEEGNAIKQFKTL